MNMEIEQRLICWPRYDKYEVVSGPDCKRYIRPTEDAHPCAFHHVKEKEKMVIDAINVGMLVLGQKTDSVIERAVLDFVTKYGLLGLMTTLPNSPDYMEYFGLFCDDITLLEIISTAAKSTRRFSYRFPIIAPISSSVNGRFNENALVTACFKTRCFFSRSLFWCAHSKTSSVPSGIAFSIRSRKHAAAAGQVPPVDMDTVRSPLVISPGK